MLSTREHLAHPCIAFESKSSSPWMYQRVECTLRVRSVRDMHEVRHKLFKLIKNGNLKNSINFRYRCTHVCRRRSMRAQDPCTSSEFICKLIHVLGARVPSDVLSEAQPNTKLARIVCQRNKLFRVSMKLHNLCVFHQKSSSSSSWLS